jgi:hypothetical protein
MPAGREAPEPDLADGNDGPDGAASADAIEVDIERTREQLVNTVDALSERLDVKTQARHTVGNLRNARTAAIAEAALVVVVISAAAVVVWRRRR